jgi:beta-glucosidase
MKILRLLLRGFCCSLFLFCLIPAAAEATEDDPVAEMLEGMTLAEKIGQISLTWGDPRNEERWREVAGNSLGITYARKGDHEKVITHIDRLSRHYLTSTRLQLPPMFCAVGNHGLAHPLGTQFPVCIALAGTFDRDLVERVNAVTAREARSLGINFLFGPVLDVARDPRWGRIEETYGEDPYLAAEMGVAAVKGLRGTAEKIGKEKVAVCLRHFCGYGAPEGGLNCRPLVHTGEREFRSIHLYPFKEVIARTRVAAVMPAYNEIDGIPCHANEWLLRSVLRDELGFEGFTISDSDGIRRLRWDQKVASDDKAAAAMAFNAGVTMELFNPYTYQHLEELLAEGRISQARIDEGTAAVLRTKLRLGLADYRKPDVEEAVRVTGSPEHREVALEAARKSIVMLENKGSLAPFDSAKLETIAVIGPNALPKRFGGYSGDGYYENILQGIRNRVPAETKVVYAKGCSIPKPGGRSRFDMAGKLTKKQSGEDGREGSDNELIDEAVAVAEKADLVVLALGGTEYTSREAWNHHWGDRADFRFTGRQRDLIRAISGLDKPMAAVLLGGHPVTEEILYERISVIYQCWYLGSETGNAVADILFGEISPSGKLAISIPRSAGHLPVYYNFKPAPVSVKGDRFAPGQRQPYNYENENRPLYPFGYGLSYGDFAISAKLAAGTITRDASARIDVTVTNNGSMVAEEVVQLYIRDRVASVTRPVKELKDFRRIRLGPGKTEVFTFVLPAEKLAFYQADMNYAVEAGDFEIYVGNSSRDEDLLTLRLTVK